MTPEENDLQRLRELLISPLPEKGEAPVPDPELVRRAVAGELPPGQVAELLDRALESPEGSQEWALAVALRQALEQPAAKAEVVPHPRRWRPAWLALAAAAVLVIGIGLPLLHRPPGSTGTAYRGGGRAGATPVPEGRAVPRDAFRLRWEAGPPGSTYDLVLSDQNLRPVFQARNLQRPEVTVPPQALAGVKDGEPLLWQVTVHLPDGSSRRSATHLVRLASSTGGHGS